MPTLATCLTMHGASEADKDLFARLQARHGGDVASLEAHLQTLAAEEQQIKDQLTAPAVTDARTLNQATAAPLESALAPPAQGTRSREVDQAAIDADPRMQGGFEQAVTRTDELKETAAAIREGTEGAAAAHQAIVNKLKPIHPYTSVPAPTSEADARYALSHGKSQSEAKSEKYGAPSQLEEGHLVGVRLDIPSYSQHGAWVVSVHEQDKGSSFAAGTNIGYESVAIINNVSMGVVEKAAAKIASGSSKSTIAVMKGKWQKTTPAAAKARADAALNDYYDNPNSEWVQVGMDPERHSAFYDRETQAAIVGADEVIQIGAVVLAKNPQQSKTKILFQDGGKSYEGLSLRDLVESRAPADVTASHPDLLAALDEMMAIPETHKQAGYMSDEWKAAREYVIRDKKGNIVSTIQGFDAAVDYLYEQSGSHTDQVRQDDELHLVIGPPAAGKSSAIAEPLAKSVGARVIDSDDAKKLIPEFGNGIGANAVHEESKVLTKAVMKKAAAARDNIISPVVGHNPDKVKRAAQVAKAKGATVYLHSMELPFDDTFQRMLLRFLDTGRLINPEYLIGVGDKPSATYETLKDEDIFNGKAQYDNNVERGQPPILTEESGLSERVDDFKRGLPRGRRGGRIQHSSSEGQVRGSVDLTDLNNIMIRLYRSENLSTFLHESGHIYLEMIGSLAQRDGASTQTVKDFNDILAWLGATDKDSITDEMHEKFAETYEQYLREGKAPSLKLSEAFAKFTAWLTTLYRKLGQQGNLPRAALTPEISDIFDRMLASEEEVAEARRAAAMLPLFGSAASGDLTDQAYETYQRSVSRASQAGQAELLARTMEDVKRTVTKWWKEALKGEITIVLSELDNTSAWRARYIIQHNRLPSGAELDETMPQGIKLDRQAIKDMNFPAGTLPGGNGMIRKEGGVHPDVAAEALGFDSGSELLQALAGLPKGEDGTFQSSDQFAKQEAEQRLKDEHGDVLNDGTIREEALLKVHSEEQARVIVKEMKQLATMSGAGQSPSNLIMKEAARLLLSTKPMGEVMKYHKYLRAEHRASNQAAAALAKGDIKGAREAKQRQLLNFHLYRQARALANKADKQATTIRKWKKGKMTKVHPDFVAEALLMLEGVNFGKKAGAKRVDTLTVKQFETWAEEQAKTYGANFHMDSELENALDKDHYLDMTAAELTGIHDTVKSILHQGRRYTDAETAQFNSMVNSLADSIDGNATTHRRDIIEKNTWQRLGSWGRKGMSEIRRMQSLTRELDGGEAGGPVYEAVYLRIKHADDAYIDRSMRGGEALDAILSKYTAAEKIAFYNRTHIPELGQSMSLSSRLAFALNMGNAGNVEAMQNEYSDAEIEAVLETLSDKDWDVVEAIWAHIDSYWPDLKELEERTTGTAPGKVSASPFMTPSGREVTGGYYPLVANPDSSDSGRQDLEDRNSLTGMLNGGHAKKTTKHGSTIERGDWGSKRSIWLDLGVAFSHVDGVIKDIEMREAVVEVNRILNHSAFGDAIKHSKGIEYSEMMHTWLANVVGNDKPRANFLEDTISYVRNGISIAEMGLSLRTMLQQPAGITMTAAIIGERYTLQGLAKFAKHRGNVAREVMEQSAFMRNRAATFNRDVRDAQRSLGVKGLHAKLTTVAFWGVQQLDMAVSIPSWIGAHDMEIDRQVNEGEPRDEQKAVDFADGVVSRSQGSGLPRDMAGIQQGPQWKKMFTMFYTFFGAYQNLQTDLYKETSFKNVGQALKYAKNQIYITVIPALVIKALFDGLPDDEDEWLVWAAKNTASFALGGLPGVRDAANAYLSGFDYQMSPLGNVVKQSGKILEDVAEGEFDDKTLRALLMTTGYLAHMPGARAADRAVRAIEAGDFKDLDDFEDWWRLLIMGPKK